MKTNSNNQKKKKKKESDLPGGKNSKDKKTSTKNKPDKAFVPPMEGLKTGNRKRRKPTEEPSRIIYENYVPEFDPTEISVEDDPEQETNLSDSNLLLF